MSAELTREMIEQVAIWLDWIPESWGGNEENPVLLCEIPDDRIEYFPPSKFDWYGFQWLLGKLFERGVSLKIDNEGDKFFRIIFDELAEVKGRRVMCPSVKSIPGGLLMATWHYIQHTKAIPGPK